MSFLAKLNIDDEEFNVLTFSIEIHQQVQPGRAAPIGRPIINHLHFTIESDSNESFLLWSISSNTPKEGKLIFYNRDGMSIARKYDFKYAFLVNYTEKFDNDSSNPFLMGLELTVGTLTLNDSVEYEDHGHLGV